MKVLRIALWMSVVYCSSGNAQNIKEQFDRFKYQQEKDFEQTIARQDSIFAQLMLEHWNTIKLITPLKAENTLPKPHDYPKVADTFQLKNIQHIPLQHTPKLMRSFTPPTVEYSESTRPKQSTSFDFYGEPVIVTHTDDLLSPAWNNVSTKEQLAAYWLEMTQTNYANTIYELLEVKTSLNLPDFGYLLLVRSFLKSLKLSPEVIQLHSWFILRKSGYEGRIGLLGRKPTLVFASRGKVYGYQYYVEAGINYYVFSSQVGEFESFYSKGMPLANVFDFTIGSSSHLPIDAKKVQLLSTDLKNQNQQLDIYYNSNMTQMLADFPQVDIRYYLNSGGSDLLNKSIEKSLLVMIATLKATQKATFLLKFVQTSFDYQSDTYQFGKEKVMYPEEFLAYPYTDCDDRVVFLAYLLRRCTDIPMVLIEFPGHLALGLRLPGPNFGESVEYQGYTFTLCDPTYRGAPLGAVIPSADRSRLKVIEF